MSSPPAGASRASRLTSLASLIALLAISLALPPANPLAPRAAARATPAHPVDLAELAAACEDADWTKRWNAVDELGRRRDRRALPLLLRRALHDGNSHPRWRALWALKTVDPAGAGAIPALRTGLSDAVADPVARRNAAVALAFFGRSEGRAELLAALEDPDPFRRWEAAYSLGAIGDQRVAAALDRALARRSEPDPRVRGQIVLSLARAGGRSAVPRLLETLTTDDSPEVRRRAAMTLAASAGGPISSALETALRGETDPRVRRQIEAALHGAGRDNPRKEETDAAESET